METEKRMEIKGKELEFYRMNNMSDEEITKAALDDAVHTMQKGIYRILRLRQDSSVNLYVDRMYSDHVDELLNAIKKINIAFGANYNANHMEIFEFFHVPEPLKN